MHRSPLATRTRYCSSVMELWPRTGATTRGSARCRRPVFFGMKGLRKSLLAVFTPWRCSMDSQKFMHAAGTGKANATYLDSRRS